MGVPLKNPLSLWLHTVYISILAVDQVSSKATAVRTAIGVPLTVLLSENFTRCCYELFAVTKHNISARHELFCGNLGWIIETQRCQCERHAGHSQNLRVWTVPAELCLLFSEPVCIHRVCKWSFTIQWGLRHSSCCVSCLRLTERDETCCGDITAQDSFVYNVLGYYTG